MRHWIGLAELIEDAIHHGAAAIERVHREVAHGPLAILVHVRSLAPAARVVDLIQDGIIASVYASVRGVNAAVAALVKATLRAAERPPAEAGPSGPGAASADPEGGRLPGRLLTPPRCLSTASTPP